MSETYTHKELIALIKKISGQANFIGTPRVYVDIFDGDLAAAVWLNQVVYWDGKNKEPIGFYKTYKEWKKELGLTEAQVRRVAKLAEKLGLVNITFKKVYGTPKNHYLVVWPELLKEIQSNLNKVDPEESEGSQSEGSEGSQSEGSKEGQESEGSLTETETPSEITVEKQSKKGDLLDGMLFYGRQAIKQGEDKVEEIVTKLEQGLRLNFPRGTKDQSVYRRILETGKPIEAFIQWVKSDERRLSYAFLYAKDTGSLWRDFPQAFGSAVQSNLSPSRVMPTLERDL